MKRFLRSKLVLSLVAFIMIAAAVAIPLSGSITHSLAASRSSHNVAYVNYDDSGFTGGGASGNIFGSSIIGGPSPTSSSTDSVTYNGMTFTPLSKASLSTATLAPYDTLILFEVCDIATSLTSSQHDAINAYLAAGNKIILFDGDRCAPNAGGNADYSWFKYPFSTSNPGPRGASGTLTVVENSSLTNGYLLIHSILMNWVMRILQPHPILTGSPQQRQQMPWAIMDIFSLMPETQA